MRFRSAIAFALCDRQRACGSGSGAVLVRRQVQQVGKDVPAACKLARRYHITGADDSLQGCNRRGNLLAVDPIPDECAGQRRGILPFVAFDQPLECGAYVVGLWIDGCEP